MNRQQNRGWFASIVLVVFAIVSLELDSIIPMSQSLHHVVIAAALILILSSLTNYIYQRAKVNTKSSKHTWWLDDDWSNWGGI